MEFYCFGQQLQTYALQLTQIEISNYLGKCNFSMRHENNLKKVSELLFLLYQLKTKFYDSVYITVKQNVKQKIEGINCNLTEIITILQTSSRISIESTFIFQHHYIKLYSIFKAWITEADGNFHKFQLQSILI